MRRGNKPADTPRRGRRFLDAKLAHSVFLEEMIQSQQDKKVSSLRIVPTVAKRFAAGQLAFAASARDGQQSQSFQENRAARI
jgi:hypothetical protein